MIENIRISINSKLTLAEMMVQLLSESMMVKVALEGITT